MEIHKNRTFPAHLSLDEQIEEAYAIANRKKVMAENSELRRKIKSDKTKGSGQEGTQRDTRENGEPKLAPQDLASLQQSGFTWNANKNVYQKPLAGSNKVLYYNPKTNKRFTKKA